MVYISFFHPKGDVPDILVEEIVYVIVLLMIFTPIYNMFDPFWYLLRLKRWCLKRGGFNGYYSGKYFC